MRFSLIFVMLFAFGMAQNENSKPALTSYISLIIKTAIGVIMGNLKKADHVSIPDLNGTLPDSIKNIGEGYAGINGSMIKFDVKTTIYDVIDKPDVNNSTVVNIIIQLYIKKVSVNIGYFVDLGLFKELPFYGSGDIVLGVKAAKVNVSLDLLDPLNKISIDNFVFDDLSFKADKSSITGLLGNPDISSILTNLMNVLEEAVFLLYNLQKTCITCILQETIQYVLNTVLKNKPDFELHCACLSNQKPSKNYDLKAILEGLVQTSCHGSFENKITYLFNDMAPMWIDVYQRTRTLLEERGSLKDLM